MDGSRSRTHATGRVAGGGRWRRPNRRKWFEKRIARGIVAFVALSATVGITRGPGLSTTAVAAAPSGWQWYKTDTHVHSVLSGDALDDLGIISKAAKDRGYNAMFITDHQAGSNFPISTVVANHVVFEDSLGTKWSQDTFGNLTATTSALASSPVKSGTKSMHLKSSSDSFGETFIDLKRGPNLRSGDLILKFSVYPTRIDSGSGAYVSVSIGGDASVKTPEGYTTQAGVVTPGKSTILVWQLGSPRTPSSDPNQRVLPHPLSYILNTWNSYTINITQALSEIPVADRPLDFNALSQIKMSAAANAGTADVYFDAFNLDASTPVPSGQEFANRNGSIHNFDTSTYKALPSIEMGFSRHVNRFNFDIPSAEYNSFFQCDAAGNNCKITRGIDAIAPTQQTGYPAQLNHPNLPGGVKLDEIVADNYRAFGADIMETREDSAAVPTSTMIDIWDSMLQRGTIVMGAWSSDMHKVATLDAGSRGLATYLYAPALELNDLMRSLFEGRAYMAGHQFAGRVLFNLDSVSSEPYPARYPVYVPDTQTTANVRLSIPGSVANGSKVRWLVNGSQVALDTATASYQATKTISLSGAYTYVRAEVIEANGARGAMTEPIFFIDVPSLPSGLKYHLEGVTTNDGKGYTKLFTKGVTASSWNSGSNALQLSLENRADSLVELTASTGSLTPNRVVLDGTVVPRSASMADFNAAITSTWYHEDAADELHVKLRQASSIATALLEFGGASDTQPPTAPGGLTATPVTSGSARIDLAWSPSTDNVGVSGYRVYRDGALLATVGGATTSYSDSSGSSGTTYTYTVAAFDAAANVSPLSAPASATMPTVVSQTFTPAADSYVDSSVPANNYGLSTKLRADASPTVRSYLRFSVQGLSRPVARATLRLNTTSSASAPGFEVRPVTDDSWGETTITFNNAPATGAVAATSGAFATATWITVDVTALVTGNDTYSLALTTPSTTAMSTASRESGATSPQLIVEQAP